MRLTIPFLSRTPHAMREDVEKWCANGGSMLDAHYDSSQRVALMELLKERVTEEADLVISGQHPRMGWIKRTGRGLTLGRNTDTGSFSTVFSYMIAAYDEDRSLFFIPKPVHMLAIALYMVSVKKCERFSMDHIMEVMRDVRRDEVAADPAMRIGAEMVVEATRAVIVSTMRSIRSDQHHISNALSDVKEYIRASDAGCHFHDHLMRIHPEATSRMVDILGADAALFWMPSIHALSSNSFVNTSSRGLSPCHMGMVDKQVEALNALSGDPVTIDKLHHGFDQSTSFLIAWSTYLYAIKRYRPDYAPLIRGDDTQVGSMAMDILHHRPSPWTEHVSYPDDMPIAWVNDWIHAWRGYPHAEHFVPYHQRPMIYERLSAYHREKHGSMSADDPRILDHISHMHMIMHRDISGRIIDDAANLILSHFDHGPGRDYPDYMCRAISDYVRLVHMHRSYHPQGPDDHGRIEDMALAISNRTATMSVRLRLSDDMLARVIARRGSTSVHRVFDPFHQDLGLHALTSYITSRYHGLNRRDSFSHAFISEASVRESIQHSLMPCSCRAIAILMLGDESMMLDGARILQAMDNSSTS